MATRSPKGRCRTAFQTLMRAALFASAFLVLSQRNLYAGILFAVEDLGSSVRITASGSIDTTGWSLQGVTGPNVYIRGRNVAVGSSSMQRIDSNTLAVSGGASVSLVFPPLGNNIYLPVAGSATGQTVIFQANSATAWALFLPAGYTSNAPLSGSAVYNVSRSALGMTETTNWKWYLDGNAANDAKSVTVMSITPEPSGFLLSGLGVGAAGWWRRRKKLSSAPGC